MGFFRTTREWDSSPRQGGVQNDKKTIRHSDPEQSEGEESSSNGILRPAEGEFMMTDRVSRRWWEVASNY